MTAIALPTLSELDPEQAGEGSLDPLGLAPVADRLADLLAPHVRARMLRIRFVTAIAVGAVVTESLWDELPEDGVSTPPICFEWLVLESFVRKARETGALDAPGVPGSAKAKAVIAQGRRLSAGSYLKTPSVFGFNGVYQLLARGMRVVDEERMPAERTGELAATWEAEQGFRGFLDGHTGSEGGRLRAWLTDAVRSGLRAGRCVTLPRAQLWIRVARSLPPLKAGPRERSLLRTWLLDPDQPIQRELALALADRPFASEASLLSSIEERSSDLLRQRIDAISAYEKFSAYLDAAFVRLRRISTLQGSQPLKPAAAAAHPVIEKAARELPDAYARMFDALEPLDVLRPTDARLSVFGERLGPAGLVEQILEHHRRVQQDKGKREWFEDRGAGVVVRSLYWQGDPAQTDDSAFLHPFRVTPLWQFMADTAP